MNWSPIKIVGIIIGAFLLIFFGPGFIWMLKERRSEKKWEVFQRGIIDEVIAQGLAPKVKRELTHKGRNAAIPKLPKEIHNFNLFYENEFGTDTNVLIMMNEPDECHVAVGEFAANTEFKNGFPSKIQNVKKSTNYEGKKIGEHWEFTEKEKK